MKSAFWNDRYLRMTWQFLLLTVCLVVIFAVFVEYFVDLGLNQPSDPSRNGYLHPHQVGLNKVESGAEAERNLRKGTRDSACSCRSHRGNGTFLKLVVGVEAFCHHLGGFFRGKERSPFLQGVNERGGGGLTQEPRVHVRTQMLKHDRNRVNSISSEFTVSNDTDIGAH